jgi:hypothetical protein
LKRELQPALDELAIQTQEAIATLVSLKLTQQAAEEKRKQPDTASASGAGEIGQDVQSSIDGVALARMVESQAEKQGQRVLQYISEPRQELSSTAP